MISQLITVTQQNSYYFTENTVNFETLGIRGIKENFLSSIFSRENADQL